MLSDFEKNSLGLVWMALAVWSCRSAMHRGGWSRWALLAGAMTLGVLTHVGAFAVTGSMICIAVVVWNWPRWKLAHRPHTWIEVALWASCVTALIAVMFYFAPHRALAILRAPLEIWRSGGPLHRMFPRNRVLVVSVYVVSGFGLRRVWHEKAGLLRADLAVVIDRGAHLR